jgi:hypothetical protein
LYDNNIDILENELIKEHPGVLEALLRDHTTQKYIFWATDNYKELGKNYQYHDEILPESISGENDCVIMPRVKKNKDLQQSRIRKMAEVFTPSWICNAQNNLIDNSWFGRENVFNCEIVTGDNINTWRTNTKLVTFPEKKTWRNYVRENRLEISCGEAPYITSRYDTTTGGFIPVSDRVGLLDRKLRVVSENCHKSGEWLKAAQLAFKSTYAYEWQGDSLLLSREAMLITFIENYLAKFNKEPLAKSIKYIAYIISWNVWQMDGLKAVVPNSCKNKVDKTTNLFGEKEVFISFCDGCMKNDIKKHNGTYCIIKDWGAKDKQTGTLGNKIRYQNLL